MKCTPQNTIVDASTSAAIRDSAERVADVVGDVLDLGQLVVVGEDDRVALAARRRTSSGQSAGSSALGLTASTVRPRVSTPCRVRGTPRSPTPRRPPPARSGTGTARHPLDRTADADGGQDPRVGAGDRRAHRRHARLALFDRLDPTEIAELARQHTPGRAEVERQEGTLAHDPTQAVWRRQRHGTTASVTFADVELHALAGVLAQRHQARAGEAGGKSALLEGLDTYPTGFLPAHIGSGSTSREPGGLRLRAYRADDHTPSVVVADGTRPAWRADAFTRVLVDVPCSGLGALRRRPESRWRRGVADVEQLHPLQLALLASAIDSVCPGRHRRLRDMLDIAAKPLTC